MSVRQCQKKVDAVEFREWLAYSQIEPFGSDWENHKFGQTASLLYNPHRGEGAKALQPEDWLPQEEEDYWDSAEGQVFLMQSYAAWG